MGAAIVFLFNEELIMPCYRGFLVKLKRCFSVFFRAETQRHTDVILCVEFYF